MALFRWQGVRPNGETVPGEMNAQNVAADAVRLRRIRPLPGRIRAKGRGR